MKFSYRYITTTLIGGALAISLLAQAPQARIAGLENNDEYMSLLGRLQSATERESGLSSDLNSLRAQITSSDGAAPASLTDSIIAIETMLFGVRAERAQMIDKVNSIEQDWILQNIGNQSFGQSPVQAEVEVKPEVHKFGEDEYIRKTLSTDDYNDLVKSEELEAKANALAEQYITNHYSLEQLRDNYVVASSLSDAVIIEQHYDSLMTVNIGVADSLEQCWGFINDNKTYAYSMLMETMQSYDTLDKFARFERESEELVMRFAEEPVSPSLVKYISQKRAMVNREITTSEVLKLPLVKDSLTLIARTYDGYKFDFPSIDFEKREFIDYEDAEILKVYHYSVKNPIPKTVIYEVGTIYRILLGGFYSPQTVATFRRAFPLSVHHDDKLYKYYAGGYQTFDQAQEAQKMLKKAGFRRPEIVMWQDGVDRNLDRDPLPVTQGCRLVIDGTQNLDKSVSQSVDILSKGSAISKVGADQFVVAPISSKEQATILRDAILENNPDLNIEIKLID